MSGSEIEAKREALNAALTDRLESWLPEIIGGRAVRGGAWEALSTKQHGIGDSLRVQLAGSRRGKWYHHAAEVGGDPLGLIAHARNCSMAEAWKIAKEILGGTVPALDEGERQRRETARLEAQREEDRRRADIERQARHILFIGSTPGLLDTPAEQYFQRRGINLRKLGRPVNALRFHPALMHRDLGERFPAIVAAIVGSDGRTVAIHRTWLVRRHDPVTRAPYWDRVRRDREGADGKLTLGAFKHVGGCVRLWAGERVDKHGEIRRGRPWAEAEDGSGIILVEGIENGLSLVQARPDVRVAACVAVAGLANVWLPDTFREVWLAGDNDQENTAARAAFERALLIHLAAGRTVRDMRPPLAFKDYNDMLCAARGVAA